MTIETTGEELELSAELTLRQWWRLLVREWRSNPIVPIARKLEWQRILILFLFMVLCKALSEAIPNNVPPKFWTFRGAVIGWHAYELFVFVLHGAFWSWIIWGAFARMTQTSDLASVPLSRTSWIAGLALPLLLGVLVCNLLIEAFMHIRYWNWLVENWPVLTSVVYYGELPSSTEKMLAIIEQAFSPFRSLFSILSLLLMAFIVAERAILTCHVKKNVSVRVIVYLLLPVLLLRLWGYFVDRLDIALNNFAFLHMTPDPSGEMPVIRSYLVPLVSGLVSDLFALFGVLWLFRFFLRRDLPRFGESFPAVE